MDGRQPPAAARTPGLPDWFQLLGRGAWLLVGLGAEGVSVALAMLAITLLTNNTLQNLLEPLAFGKALRLHSLVVMLVTTAGTLLFGVPGATLAAPVTAVALRTVNLLQESGLFAQRAPAPGRSKATA